jgi:hypothetical protein
MHTTNLVSINIITKLGKLEARASEEASTDAICASQNSQLKYLHLLDAVCCRRTRETHQPTNSQSLMSQLHTTQRRANNQGGGGVFL